MLIVNEWIEILVIGLLGIALEKAIVWIFKRSISHAIFILLLVLALAISFSKVNELNFLQSLQEYHNLIIAVSSGYYIGIIYDQLKKLVNKSDDSDKVDLLHVITNLFRLPTFIISISSVLRYSYGINEEIESKFIVITVFIDLFYVLFYLRLKNKDATIGIKKTLEALSYQTLFIFSTLNFTYILYLVVGWLFIDDFIMEGKMFLYLFLSILLASMLKKQIRKFRTYLFDEKSY